MQKNSIKSVFIKSSIGLLSGNVPVLEAGEIDLFFDIKELYENHHPNNIRVVVGYKVYEMHMDKHKNIIFRCYEKS